MTKPHVIIHTDGSCIGNPGPGGWAATLYSELGDKVHQGEISGSEKFTTNNRMELTAAVRALRTLTRPCKVTVYSDSRYVVDGASRWMLGWIARDWQDSLGKPIKNVEMWKQLEKLSRGHDIEWKWVKGHAGLEENERCDELARSRALEIANA
jgi:ribonuclease HI